MSNRRVTAVTIERANGVDGGGAGGAAGTREVGEAYAAWSEPFERLIRPSSICVMESAKLKIRLSCVTTTTARSSETATVQLMLPLRGAYWVSRIDDK